MYEYVNANDLPGHCTVCLNFGEIDRQYGASVDTKYEVSVNYEPGFRYQWNNLRIETIGFSMITATCWIPIWQAGRYLRRIP